jgi:release factor glutamine methyltransferase
MTTLVSGEWLWQWRTEQLVQLVEHDDQHILSTELDWFLRELSGLDRLALRLGLYRTRDLSLEKSPAELSQLWHQRVEQRVPIQYLLGRVTWRHFQLQVTPAVLIPRPETEIIIDLAIAHYQSYLEVGVEHPLRECSTPTSKQLYWADLGTGSGAIALGLALELPNTIIHAVDISDAAIAIARHNAETLGVSNRVQFHQGSWLEPLAQWRGQLVGIVSNPPYIPQDLIPTLQPEVAWHEPHLALAGGKDGLEFIRQIIATAVDYLCPGGILILECMAGQGKAIANLINADKRYTPAQIHDDLAGLDRFVATHYLGLDNLANIATIAPNNVSSTLA